MLVLSRKNQESVNMYVNGPKITLTVVKTTLGRARIGINAPRDVHIVRDELEDEGKATA